MSVIDRELKLHHHQVMVLVKEEEVNKPLFVAPSRFNPDDLFK